MNIRTVAASATSAALVGAGALSVLVFPFVADRLPGRPAPAESDAEAVREPDPA